MHICLVLNCHTANLPQQCLGQKDDFANTENYANSFLNPKYTFDTFVIGENNIYDEVTEIEIPVGVETIGSTCISHKFVEIKTFKKDKKQFVLLSFG